MRPQNRRIKNMENVREAGSTKNVTEGDKPFFQGVKGGMRIFRNDKKRGLMMVGKARARNCCLMLMVVCTLFVVHGCGSDSASEQPDTARMIYSGEAKHSVIGSVFKETITHSFTAKVSEAVLGWVATDVIGLKSEEDERYEAIMADLGDISFQLDTLHTQVTLLAHSIEQVDMDVLSTDLQGYTNSIQTSVTQFMNSICDPIVDPGPGVVVTDESIASAVEEWMGKIDHRDHLVDMSGINTRVTGYPATPILDEYTNLLVQNVHEGTTDAHGALRSLAELYAYLSSYQVMGYIVQCEYYHYRYSGSYTNLVSELNTDIDAYLANLNNSYMDNAEKIISLFLKGDLTQSLDYTDNAYYGGISNNIGYVTGRRSAFVRIVWTRNGEVDPDSRYESFDSRNPYADGYTELWDWLETTGINGLPVLSFTDVDTGEVYPLSRPIRNVFNFNFDDGKKSLGTCGVLRYEIPYTDMGLNTGEDPVARVSVQLACNLQGAPEYEGESEVNAGRYLLNRTYSLEMETADPTLEDGSVAPTLTLAAYMPENHYYAASPGDGDGIVDTGGSHTLASYRSRDFHLWYYKTGSDRIHANHYVDGKIPGAQPFYLGGADCLSIADECYSYFYSYGRYATGSNGFDLTNADKKYYINKYALTSFAFPDKNDHRGFHFEKKYFTILGKIWDDPYLRHFDLFALRNDHSGDHYYIKDYIIPYDETVGDYQNLSFFKEDSGNGKGKYDEASWFMLKD